MLVPHGNTQFLSAIKDDQGQRPQHRPGASFCYPKHADVLRAISGHAELCPRKAYIRGFGASV